MSNNKIDEIEQALLNRWPETRINPTLERIALLADLLGSPQLSYPTIHIAGTNGKTTTTRLIDSLCFELGLRTGRFTSPHLESYLERICINGEMISEAAMIATYEDVAPYFQLVDERMSHRLSFFEAITGLSFVAFAEHPVDVGIFECGMGGEWDSTNVINAKVSVVTPIGLDHTQYLGDTLTAIATTKSGIIKPGSFAVLARQELDPAQVLMRKCAEVEATPIREGVEYQVSNRSLAVGGQLISIKGVYGDYEELFLPLHGEHQASNAATALAAVEVFAGERKLDEELVRTAFAKASSPGRCEIVHRSPTVIIDAAHNPHGAKSLRKTIESEFDFDSIIGIVAPMGDKDTDGILEEFEAIMTTVIITKNSSHRAAPIDELAAQAREIFGGDRVLTKDSLESAIDAAITQAKFEVEMNEKSCAVLIAGSVISAGEARAFIRKRATR
ncbi:MAG: bifunctional folylpolyglutamate synthase/dihydrofolate synthase [Candidatus Nanopelagicaceae bacterium]|nr:bifunctional folylpolyglutamate synthase/dihydrofolate synthase [Actinomycetota bacterium]NCX75781.1 bifunctional folylpolyglutamate synthase/dihydrofolate synthase [Actinomycetota bacterium]NDA40100.1 bifunctional folylpolyglutamate synthase/dihydrofolate synthase [Actinomycetota bacterium]NDE47396.1 bifunctional folylpolyglutamate synthase/dihydrofolate synthase [Actinomycetota bacterium]NDE95746.1 bifunctional folylpolyglutamate synthase/dihydrofolate synthase [Actinomycetota bacterium]